MSRQQPYRLALHLLKNGLRYRYLKFRGKPCLPQALSLEITHRCVAECIMCNIWKVSKDIPDLPVDDWLDLLSNPLFSNLVELDITGGEPFLRRDIHELIQKICALKNTNLRNLKSIAITTNGLLTKRILAVVEQAMPRLARNDLDLVLVCAVDAVNSLHDQIRNYTDAWKKVNETIEKLVEQRASHSNLIIGLKTTVLPLNVAELDDISTYANKHGLFKIISPLIITGGRYLNRDKSSKFEFNAADRSKIIRFFSSESDSWDFHGKALIRYFQTGEMKKPCSCGFNYFFIRSTGDVFLCPLVDDSVGNIKNTDIARLYSSRHADSVRKKVGRYSQCMTCTEPGIERYSLPFEGFEYLKMLFQMGSSGFSDFHYHMGFDKYLGR